MSQTWTFYTTNVVIEQTQTYFRAANIPSNRKSIDVETHAILQDAITKTAC